MCLKTKENSELERFSQGKERVESRMEKKTMKTIARRVQDEEGSILVVALLIMVLLTMIGVWGSTTTESEIRMARNETFYKRAFFNADSGVYATPKLISAAFDGGSGDPDLSGTAMSYVGSTNTFFREIMGYDAHDPEYEVMFSLEDHLVEVDVERLGQENLVGASAEFAAGAEGIGTGSSGGVGILYQMNSRGMGPANAATTVTAVYRKVVGTPGGL